MSLRRPSLESASSLPRAATFSVPSVRGGRTISAGTSGHASTGQGANFNALRNVPPPARPSSTSGAPSRSSGHASPPGAVPMPRPSVRGNALLTRAVVMVDEATEPGIGDDEGEARRVALVQMVMDGGDPRMGSATGSSAGAAVAFAIRKRLKSDDHVAVLNTLTLLDEVMRTCPYFYRYCANDKFFRRLWRFVDPEYKSDIRERLPFGRAGKVVAQQRSGEVNVELGERVLILIRAWAEELSIMHSGQQDPDAGFFLERYSNKRLRIKFPDVPPTATPWVCHVRHGGPGRSRFGSSTSSGGRGMSKTTSPLPKNLSLGEVENTVNLLENMMEKANDISEVQTDVCADLVDRCRLISQHIDTMSATMEKDEDIARAIKVSERLHSTVKKYDFIMESGVFHPSVPPTVDGLGDDSADESYGPTDREYSQGGGAAGSSEYYNRGSNALGATLGGAAVAAAAGAAGSSRRRSDHSVASSSSSLEQEVERQRQRAEEEREREREKEVRSREKAAAKKEKEAERKRAEKKEARRAADASTTRSSGKSEKSAAKAAISTSGKSSKSGKSSSRSAAAAAKDSLVDVADQFDTKSTASSTDSDEKKSGNVFSSLAERHSTNKSARSPPHSNSSAHRPLSTTGSVGSVGQGMSSFVGNVSDMSIRGGQQQGNGLPGSPQQQQQQHPMQMPYGSMMMMPNPMAMGMYGSFNPAMQPQQQQQTQPQQQQQPQPHQPQGYGNGMPSAYNTVNPAMYYSSFNPMAYGSVNPMMQQPQQPQQPQQMSQNLNSSQSSTPSQAVSETSTYQPPPSQPGQFQLQQQTPASPLSPPGPMAPPPPAPAPPPPPQASSYMTVTNAPAPPPLEPPPPVVPAPAPAPPVSQDHSPGSSSAGQTLLHNFPPAQQMQPSASFVQQPMFNPAMYSSVSGQPPMSNQSFLFPSGPQQPGQQPGGQYNSVYGMPSVQGQGHHAPPALVHPPGPPGLPLAQGQPDPNQASVYQMAMANAAAAYNAAASAYQTVQGQAPLVPQAAPPSSSTSNPQESTNVPK